MKLRYRQDGHNDLNPKKNMIEEVIKKRMRELGITQKQMAEKAKMTQPQLSNFFNKKHPITTVTLERIIQELNLTIRQKDK